MSIEQGTAFQFLLDQGINGIHDIENDNLFFAMYTTLAEIALATVDLQAAIGNELVGTGYTAGGIALTPTVIYTPGGPDRPILNFVDLVLPNSTWGQTPGTAAQGAVIYNASPGPQVNKVLWVLNFVSPIIVSGGELSIIFPDPSDPTSAIVRLIG